MSEEDSEKLNRIEELKSKLFSKNFPTKTEHRDSFTSPKRLDVPDSWVKSGIAPGSLEKFFTRASVFKKFFLFNLIGSLIFSALVSVITVLIGEFNEIAGRVLLTLFMVILM